MLNENIFKLLSKKRNAIMGIAAISVLIFHYTFYPIFTEGTFFWKIEDFIRKHGNLGVDIFFLLSGFGLLYSIEKNGTKKFYYNRFKRLIIPYTFSVIINSLDNGVSLIDALKGYIGYSFLFEDINAVPWFIPAIAITYLLFPLYYRLFNKSKNKSLFTVCALIVWYISLKLFNVIIRPDLYGYLTRIPSFIIGTLFGHYSKYGYVDENRIKSVNIAIIVISFILFAVSIYLLYLNGKGNVVLSNLLSKYYFPAFALAMSFPMIYTTIFSLKNIVLKKIDKSLAFVGSYSLEIYCLEGFTKSYIYMVEPYISNIFIRDIVMFIIILITVYIFNLINNIIIKKFESLTHVQELL